MLPSNHLFNWVDNIDSISKMQIMALPKLLHDTRARARAVVLILCKLGGSSCQKCCPTEKLGSFFKMLQRNIGEGDIAHFCNNELWIEWFCKLGNGATFVHYFLHFQIIPSKLVWTLEYRAHFIQAAVSSSCCMYWKLQTHVHPKHETKALQNVGNKKSWKANSGSSSTTALLAAASIELKLYRVWYTRFYLAFTGWLIQYAAKQGRISSVIEKYELKGRPSPIVCFTAQCNQLYPCHISCHIITYSANAHIHKEIFLLPKCQFLWTPKNIECL